MIPYGVLYTQQHFFPLKYLLTNFQFNLVKSTVSTLLGFGFYLATYQIGKLSQARRC